MNRISSANGTTATANVDIVPIMRTFTTLNGTDDTISPFRPRGLSFICGAQTNLIINGETARVELDSATGEYVLNLEKYDVIIKTLVVVESGIVWRTTCLF